MLNMKTHLGNQYFILTLSADQFGLDGGFGELPLDGFSLVGAVPEASSFSCGGIAKMLLLDAQWLLSKAMGNKMTGCEGKAFPSHG